MFFEIDKAAGNAKLNLNCISSSCKTCLRINYAAKVLRALTNLNSQEIKKISWSPVCSQDLGIKVNKTYSIILIMLLLSLNSTNFFLMKHYVFLLQEYFG